MDETKDVIPTAFGLNDILANAKGVPDDLEDWNRHWEHAHESIRKAERDGKPVPEERGFIYRGVCRYVIENGRETWIILARERRNGTYEVLHATANPTTPKL